MNITALAVIIDSAVTVGVGWRLNRTAKREVKNAVKDIEPAIHAAVEDIANEFQSQIKQDIAKVIQKMIPLVIQGVKKSRSEPNTKLEHKEVNSQIQNPH